MSKLFIIGSGGREHAIVHALAQDARVEHIQVFPGNAGMAQEPKTTCLMAYHFGEYRPRWPLTQEDITHLVQWIRHHRFDYVVIGPEAPLALGISEHLQEAGIQVFACTSQTAQLETSKQFAKTFMREAGIPCAQDYCFTLKSKANAFLNSPQFWEFTPTGACVVKYDGLASGKGVIVCESQAETQQALETLWQQYHDPTEADVFPIVLEERLNGREASLLAFCDGESVALMPAARDHKRLRDHNQGPNTGGMGVYAPLPDIDSTTLAEIKQQVFIPFLRTLKQRSLPYCGVIFVGLMWDARQQFRVLEFNCRFGDPEAQTLLSLLRTPLLDVIAACCHRKLRTLEVNFDTRSAVSVVLAAPGYPEKPQTRIPITLKPIAQRPHTTSKLFHAATLQNTEHSHLPPLLSNGGRVFTATAIGQDLEQARQAAYTLAHSVEFEGKQFRSDIAAVSTGTS